MHFCSFAKTCEAEYRAGGLRGAGLLFWKGLAKDFLGIELKPVMYEAKQANSMINNYENLKRLKHINFIL